MKASAQLRPSQAQATVSLDGEVISDSGHSTDDIAADHFLGQFTFT